MLSGVPTERIRSPIISCCYHHYQHLPNNINVWCILLLCFHTLVVTEVWSHSGWSPLSVLASTWWRCSRFRTHLNHYRTSETNASFKSIWVYINDDIYTDERGLQYRQYHVIVAYQMIIPNDLQGMRSLFCFVFVDLI